MNSKLILALALLLGVNVATYSPGFAGVVTYDFAVKNRRKIAQYILTTIEDAVKVPDIFFD